jgi:hypothetical protein
LLRPRANELAWHGRVESYLQNYALARKLCRQAGEVSKDNDLVLDNGAKAVGNADDVAQAEELATKRDRLPPEDTRNQKLCEPEFYSIIEETPLTPWICSPQPGSTSKAHGRFLMSARAYAMKITRTAEKPTMFSSALGKTGTHNIPILRQAKAEYKKLTATASAAASAPGKRE